MTGMIHCPVRPLKICSADIQSFPSHLFLLTQANYHLNNGKLYLSFRTNTEASSWSTMFVFLIISSRICSYLYAVSNLYLSVALFHRWQAIMNRLIYGNQNIQMCTTGAVEEADIFVVSCNCFLLNPRFVKNLNKSFDDFWHWFWCIMK